MEHWDKIFLHDCRDMKHIPNQSVHLVITSPPYNVTKTYDQNLTLKEYLELLTGMIAEAYRVLVANGIVAINIANVGRKPYIPLDAYIIQILHTHKFLVFQEIIWNKEASAGGSCAWGSWQSASNPSLRDVHEYIILATKAESLNEVIVHHEISPEIPKKVEGKKISIETHNLFKNVWEFQTESAKRVNHPAPFPVELPLRLIYIFSKPGDVILDPFIGSGSVAIAAILSKRHYIGYDINAEYIVNAQKRIDAFQNPGIIKMQVTSEKKTKRRRASNAATKD